MMRLVCAWAYSSEIVYYVYFDYFSNLLGALEMIGANRLKSKF